MKKRILILLCLLLIAGCLLPFSSCASGSQLLYSVTDGDRTFEIYGSDSRASRIRVTDQDGNQLWQTKVKAKKSVGEQNGTYGFQILDLNFDGYNDLKIAVDASGEQLTEICFLQDPKTGKYHRSDAFSGLYTVGVDPKQHAIFSFSHTRVDEEAIGDDPATYTLTDTTTAYVWEDGKLVPYRRMSLIYYSETDSYCYTVSDYSNVINDFLEGSDRWLSPKEYESTDFSLLYYFK